LSSRLSVKFEILDNPFLEDIGLNEGLHRSIYIEAIIARSEPALDLDDREELKAKREALESTPYDIQQFRAQNISMSGQDI
jgi:hypothetical protein